MARSVFNVLVWDFNGDCLEHYDVLPFFRDAYRKRMDKKALQSRPALRKFIEGESMYVFWSRCQYEMIVHGWPARKKEYKIDVHEQVMMNIDVITDLLYNEIKKD